MKEKIYLLPGLMTDKRLWSRILPFLQEFELIHVEIPKSDNFEEITEFLFDFIKEESINILGFSLGGYIASYFAVKYPKRVKRLFMLSATPAGSNEKETMKRKEKFNHLEKNGFKGLTYKKAKSLLEEKNQSDEELIQIIQNMYYELGKSTFISQLTSTFNKKDLFKDLINLNFPIYFFYNSKDRLLNHESLNKLTSTKSKITFLKREAIGHNLPLEEPYEVSKHIKNWMKSNN